MKLRVRSGGALLFVAAAVGCDVPTGMPRWETTWITPAQETSVSVVDLLPAGLDVNSDTSAFVLPLDPVSVTFQLSQFCPSCPNSGTVAVPKPAFNQTVTTTMPLGANVTSVDIASGEVIVELTNGFDFDPIRPSASARGSITVVLRSGTTTVGTLILDGNTRAFAPNTTIIDTLVFQPSTVTGDLDVRVTVNSPAGDPTTMSPSDQLSVELTSPGIEVSEARFVLPNTPVPADTVDLPLGGVPGSENVNSGELLLEIVNPLGVTGTMTLTFDPDSGSNIVKTVPIAAGTSTPTIEFTGEELEQILGQDVTLISSVTFPAGQQVTVTPSTVISVSARLRAVVEVGGGDDEEEEEN